MISRSTVQFTKDRECDGCHQIIKRGVEHIARVDSAANDTGLFVIVSCKEYFFHDAKCEGDK